MNDRGLSLTPLDMLKGYLLANITDERRTRLETNALWKARLHELQELGKEEDSDASRHGFEVSTPRRSVNASGAPSLATSIASEPSFTGGFETTTKQLELIDTAPSSPPSSSATFASTRGSNFDVSGSLRRALTPGLESDLLQRAATSSRSSTRCSSRRFDG